MAHSSLLLKARCRAGLPAPFCIGGMAGPIHKSNLPLPKRKACSKESIIRLRSEGPNTSLSATIWSSSTSFAGSQASRVLIWPAEKRRVNPITPNSLRICSQVAALKEMGKVIITSDFLGKSFSAFHTCSGVSGMTGAPHLPQ